MGLMDGKSTERLGNALGWIVFHGLRIRRQVTLKNLRIAFPEKSESERLSIGLKTYQHSAKMMLEFIQMPRIKKEQFLERFEVNGPGVFDQVEKEGKGAFLLTGHYGNWEYYGAYLAQIGLKISFLVKPQHNPETDRILNNIRMKMGADIIPLGMAVRNVIRAIREHHYVAIVGDQDAGRDGVFVPFFGRPASTAVGVASLAVRTGAAILFGYSVRQPGGRYQLYAERLDLSSAPRDKDERIRYILELYMRKLEAAIRLHPEQWFWMHKRWKTSPPAPVHDMKDHTAA